MVNVPTVVWIDEAGRIVRLVLARLLRAVGEAALNTLINAARAKAAELEDTSLPNPVRFSTLTNFLSELARAQGLTLQKSVINFIAETGVQAMKAELSEVLDAR